MGEGSGVYCWFKYTNYERPLTVAAWPQVGGSVGSCLELSDNLSDPEVWHGVSCFSSGPGSLRSAESHELRLKNGEVTTQAEP